MRVCALVVVLLGLAAVSALAEEEPGVGRLLIFEDKCITEYKPQEGKTELPPNRDSSHPKLLLTSKGYCLTRGNRTDLLSIEEGRAQTWWRGGNIHTSTSFDAIADYRRVEIERFPRIVAAMAEADGKGPILDLFAIETFLGVEAKPGGLADQITRTEEDGTICYSYCGEEVVRIVPGKFKIPKALRGTFSLFVHYRLRLHPVIRAELLELPNFPERMTIRWETWNAHYVRTIVHQGGSAVPDELPPAPVDTDPGDEPLWVALHGVKKVELLSRTETLDKVAELEEQEAWLDAALTLIEDSVIRGGSLTAELQGLVERSGNGPGLRLLILILANPPDPSKDRSRLVSLRKLRALRPQFAPLIDTFRASASARLGEFEVAMNLLIGALLERPELTEAWYDLAHLYYRENDLDSAWLCFEAALEIAPEHPRLAALIKHRESLREQYAEYYR